MASMGQWDNDYRNTMDTLNAYLEEEKAPKEMRRRMRRFFLQAKDIHKVKYQREVFNRMSPGLREQFAYFCNSGWMQRIIFLRMPQNLDDFQCRLHFTLVARVANKLGVAAFPSGERIIMLGDRTDTLYIMRKVTCLCVLLERFSCETLL